MTKREKRQKQYRTGLEALGMTQVGASEFFKVGARTSRRWALGEAPIPEAVLMVLALMIAKKLDADTVTELVK